MFGVCGQRRGALEAALAEERPAVLEPVRALARLPQEKRAAILTLTEPSGS